MYLPPEIKQGFDREVEQEFKQTSMVEDQYIVLDRDEALELKKAMAFKEEAIAFKEKAIAFKEEAIVLENKVEEQKEAKINIIRNLISLGTMTPAEVAKIADISVEEVLRIKAEMEG